MDEWIEAICRDPANEFLRYAFGDWLLEQGYPEQAVLVKEWAKLRPEQGPEYVNWWVWKNVETNRIHCPTTIHTRLKEEFSYRGLGVSKGWSTEREGMRALLDALLYGSREPSSNTMSPTGNVGGGLPTPISPSELRPA